MGLACARRRRLTTPHGFTTLVTTDRRMAGEQRHPQAIGIWHGLGYSLPQTAKDYVSDYGELWHDSPDTARFVRWLHTHPRVMAERAAILEWREALLWEHDAGERARLLEADEAARAGIDNSLSREIVAARRDREGSMVRPWLHADPASC